VIILAIFLNNDRSLNPSFDSKKAEKNIYTNQTTFIEAAME